MRRCDACKEYDKPTMTFWFDPTVKVILCLDCWKNKGIDPNVLLRKKGSCHGTLRTWGDLVGTRFGKHKDETAELLPNRKPDWREEYERSIEGRTEHV